MNLMKRHLLTLYTRSPLHVGSGTSVDVVDLPIMRERITGFPVIPSSSLKGVLREHGRSAKNPNGEPLLNEDQVRLLFGEDRKLNEQAGISAHAGCVQIMEAKLLAFPVRSLAGCFAWLTCPAALHRFQRDTGISVTIPAKLAPEHAIAGADLLVPGRNEIVLEEYALDIEPGTGPQTAAESAGKLRTLSTDTLWINEISQRLAVVHDENFQHFVTSCTEVVSRIAIDPGTRTNSGGALFNQENVPCEALFYSVLHILPARKPGATGDAHLNLTRLLNHAKLLQIGGDETTGLGICETKHQALVDDTEAQ